MSTITTLPRIRQVRAYTGKKAPQQQQQNSNTTTSTDQGADYHDVESRHWINGDVRCGSVPISNPMSVHHQYAVSGRKSWGINALGSVVVEVEAVDEKTGKTFVGVGVSTGGEPACFIVENHLSRFVEGQVASHIELMHHQMKSAVMNYGTKGLSIQALSAVDLALWDLLGKLRNVPVYELLGGPVRQQLPVYMTTCRPDKAKEWGFCGAKVPLPYSHCEGDVGLEKNVKFFADWREQVGAEFPLALDCYMSLTEHYTIKLCKRLAPFNLKWCEEFLPPSATYDAHRRVRQAVDPALLLSTGEHEYGLEGFAQLLDAGINIIQPDVTWCGGLTEYRRICALASAKGAMVIPHGSGPYSYHAQFCSINTPVAEFINLSPDGTTIQSFMQGLFGDSEPLPTAGVITLEQLNQPGFGLTLNKANLERPYASRNNSEVQFKLNAELVSPSGPSVMPF